MDDPWYVLEEPYLVGVVAKGTGRERKQVTKVIGLNVESSHLASRMRYLSETSRKRLSSSLLLAVCPFPHL